MLWYGVAVLNIAAMCMVLVVLGGSVGDSGGVRVVC